MVFPASMVPLGSVGTCDRALWFQVDPDPETPTAVPTEEDAVQGCVVVPTDYGEGVETEPVTLVSPDDTCYALTKPKGTEPADLLAALDTVLGREEGGSASLHVAEVSAATDCIYPKLRCHSLFGSRLRRGR